MPAWQTASRDEAARCMHASSILATQRLALTRSRVPFRGFPFSSRFLFLAQSKLGRHAERETFVVTDLPAPCPHRVSYTLQPCYTTGIPGASPRSRQLPASFVRTSVRMAVVMIPTLGRRDDPHDICMKFNSFFSSLRKLLQEERILLKRSLSEVLRR